MEIGIFGGTEYQNPAMPPGWPRSPRYWDPELARKSYAHGEAMYELADDLGLDFVTVSEHHYGGPHLEPNPQVAAAALAPRLKNARIALLGPNLTMNNPVKIAEEVAMVDLLSGGRIHSVALLRGTPNEAITYSSNPAESRQLWEESVELILRTWREPEQFGWEGVHYRYRTIAAWPKFLDPAGPRVLLSGNSLESVDFAVSLGTDLAISYAGPETVAVSVERFRAGNAALGRTIAPANVLYRTFLYVSESEERAREECTRYAFGSMNFFRPPTSGTAKVMAEIGAAGYASAGAPKEMLEKARTWNWGLPRFMGTPDQVYEQIREYHALGVGAIDFSFGGFGLPYELEQKNLELFAREVLPEVHKLPTAAPAATAASA